MADFRAFYHLGWREALALPAPEFLALAYRCSAFQGVMQARVMEQDKNETRNVHKSGARMVKSNRDEIAADPLLADVIDFG